jgi:hypothetical protein
MFPKLINISSDILIIKKAGELSSPASIFY